MNSKSEINSNPDSNPEINSKTEIDSKTESKSEIDIVSLINRDVTVGIKTFFRRPCLRRCIQSVRKFYPNIKIIVADDSPPDIKNKNQNSYKNDPLTRILSLPFDIGLAAGRNKIVNECDTKYILIVDDDTIFTPVSRIDVLYKFLSTFQQYDIVAGHGKNRKTGGYGCQYLKVVEAKKTGNKVLLYKTGHCPKIITSSSPQMKGLYNFHFYDTDRCLNYFLAKKESLLKHPWDPKLKVAEHQDFFVRAWMNKSLKVAMTPQVIFDEKRENSPRYLKYRKKRVLRFVNLAEKKTFKCVDLKTFKDKLKLKDKIELGLVKPKKANKKADQKSDQKKKKPGQKKKKTGQKKKKPGKI
jgi:glycosyltransferase involved in cell wall biosynthesis